MRCTVHRILLTIAAVTTLTTATAAQNTENPYSTRVDRREGLEGFRIHCTICHGYDAKGGGETNGPDLTTGRFRHTSSVSGLFDVIRNGVQGTAMLGINPDTPDRLVWQIMTYLDSLTPNPANINLPGSLTSGKTLFTGKGNCSSCHMINGEGGRLGPDLSRIGERRDPDTLKMDLLNPNESVEPRWWRIAVTHHDNTTLEGLRVSEDTFSLRLIDENERLWSLAKKNVDSYETNKTSTMPSVEENLTDQEIDDLVAYLFSLRKES